MSKEQGEPNLETKRKKKIKFQDKEQRRPTLRKIAKDTKNLTSKQLTCYLKTNNKYIKKQREPNIETKEQKSKVSLTRRQKSKES
jgi:hypothetical protein